ncbi:MAG TPA: NAD(P)/FAD-dependent oxidoreductase [Baekduia sp.]|uniref:NAD(P)/FAD-dependent oxidoreductase n=1 Tax=Baekduia sp. TaxID=2600305 RepID=UPI002D77E05D|nr:NAD(P)/FAD-dependent oxidoreductase [Baekduia sp.]HET6507228.1 NAD(P)/FAD-dependent oxidoreductase [Baekduia sp.]
MDFEVIIIGGGAAGLTAALVLGRARRRVLVLDDGAPSNAPAHAIGGLLGQRDTSPLELLALGREQLAELPTVTVRERRAISVRADADGVEVDGVRAEQLVVATGMDYVRPDVAGLEELWGDTVFHCPFCHGWEVAGLPLAVLGTGAHAAAMGRLLRAWSDDVVVLADPDALPEGARDGLVVDGREVVAVRAEGGKLAAVVFADGAELPRGGLLIHTPLAQRPSLLDGLGLEYTDMGAIAADDWGRTSVPRVWAAGDAAVFPPSITVAIASGTRVAGGIVHDLVVAA